MMGRLITMTRKCCQVMEEFVVKTPKSGPIALFGKDEFFHFLMTLTSREHVLLSG